jgi:hypothetical protein
MLSELTEANKAKIASSLSKIIEENREKFRVYDIYHVLKTSCNCVVPSDEVLPEREDLLSFAQKKMHDHEVHGRIHEHLLKVMENIPAVDTIPASGSHFFRYLRILKNTRSIRTNWRETPVARNVVLETNR